MTKEAKQEQKEMAVKRVELKNAVLIHVIMRMTTAHYDSDRQAFQFTLIDTWYGGSTHQGFIQQQGSAPRCDPLPFYKPFFIEKVPLSHSFY